MIRQVLVLSAAFSLTLGSGGAKEKKDAKEKIAERPAALWTEPRDVATRDLFYGQGGREHAPGAGPFHFVEEDRDGNSPKFVVKDSSGVKWKVKLGAEARPETVVTRFVWAVGYTTDEDYFVPAQQVYEMPRRLKRGGEFVNSDGVVRDARWERMDHKKLGSWEWKKNPFKDTRELNGLRVLMSMFNNYDMKDSQNSVYQGAEENRYIVSDLGATLGPTHSNWPGKTSRGDLKRYSRTDFIKKSNEEYVDFAAPSWPMMFGIVPMPPLPYTAMTKPLKFMGVKPAANVVAERWIGKHVPRADVIWMAALLRRLSPDQIRSAFRAGGYTPDEVEGFSLVIEKRIAELSEL